VEESARRGTSILLLAGAVYLVVGLTFAALAGAASPKGRVMWRLVAWALSAAVFAAHIAYERGRLHSSSAATALHASLAVALGAFGLAVAANLRAASAPSHARPLLLVSLVAWPVLTAVPAFVVALGAAALLARRRRSR
jgi:hypothetical protein